MKKLATGKKRTGAKKQAPPAKVIGRVRRCLGIAAFSVALLSCLVTLTVRDIVPVTAVIFFGVPWLLRLGFIVAAVVLLRPRKLAFRLLFGVIAIQGLADAARSFNWRAEPPVAGNGFDVTLWNAGRKLSSMSGDWKNLAGPETKLVVLVEAGSFTDEQWGQFTATHPGLLWLQLEGGIVVGVKGTVLEEEALGDRPRFRCHRLKVLIDGRAYTVIAVDIPSQPWDLREPYLNHINLAARGPRTMVLGDFNTPPSARGFDRWIQSRELVNHEHGRGFEETWPYGLPLLTLDQLWVSRDLRGTTLRREATLRSDHLRMTFRVGPVISLR